MAHLSVDHPSAGLKQLPTALAFAVALVVLYSVRGLQISNPAFILAGIAAITLATLFSAVVTRVSALDQFAIIIPVVDLLGFGAFRAGTGAASSLFVSLIILPVVWIASEKGRWYIALATAGTFVALMMPFLFGIARPTNSTELLRGIFAPFVFAIFASIINELARQSRAQFREVRALADEKERMLQRTFDYATQLEESEANFRGVSRMFRGVWDAVTEQAVIGTDVTGLVDAWNPGAEKLLGPSAREAEGKRYVFDFHVPQELEDRARELNYPPGATVLNPGFSALVESARLGEAESREWTYIRDDGTSVPVSLSVTKRSDESGETVGYLFVAADVTQAKEVSRLKDEFVGLISHELRTPLSSILGYLELMKDDDEYPLSEEQMQYLAVAERNAHRLLRLVGDLLFTAQVESGKFPLDAHDMELEGIVTAAVESARPVAASAGITLVEEILTVDSPLVHGDPIRLGQACDNLISNAIKFTPRGGTVTVSISEQGRDAVITVRDTGMGIAASELDQLFARFFRASTATRNAVPGVGLGLTITKAIVTAHRGSMNVESEEGVGTQFSMSLPLVASAAPAAALEEATSR
ncbi:PAS domain-containing protein [Galbitalea soli]|uniref:histidine kinase n=2 Tax=Galbitalea soli TaxID=1268042 RepID=A0A7C9PLY9_9MICO|nr:PAS domain-containing protein [Galbitalea soli]